MVVSMTDLLRRQWHELLRTGAVADPLIEQSFAEVCAHYAAPGRFYHTLDHIRDMLGTVASLAAHVRNLHAVKLAVWLHDVIYDSKASDNEERSADHALRLCERLGMQDGPRVAALILTTKSHDPDEDADARVLVDADLAVLGACESVYQAYAADIRREYAWVSETAYCTGRRQVLERFLAQPAIYYHLRQLEEGARRNLAAEIAQLPIMRQSPLRIDC